MDTNYIEQLQLYFRGQRRSRKALWIALALIVMAVLVSLSGCATPHQVNDIDTTLDTKGHSTYGEIGINDKGQAIVQITKSIEVELRSQEMANYYLAEKLDDAVFHLHDCRVQMADPKNGGSGETAPIPSVASLTTRARTTQDPPEVGLTEGGDLVAVRKKFLDEQLKEDRKTQVELEQMIQELKPMREECERLLGYKLAGRQ